MDIITVAHRTKVWRWGPFSLTFYVLHPTQYHPRRKLRIRMHFQWRGRCVEMAI